VRLIERLRSLLVEIRRRRVLEVVAIYGGLAFAMLQGADVVIPALNLSPTLITALTVLVLLGLPVAAVVGWIYDVDSGGRLRKTPPAAAPAPDDAEDEHGPVPIRWSRIMAALAVAGLIVAASWAVAVRISPVEKAMAIEDPRGSYLVAPLRTRGQTEADATLANRVARRLTRQLRGWEALRTVTTAAYDGMASKLGLGEDDLPSLDQALDMAGTQRAGSLIGLDLDMSGDSLYLEAALYDVNGREEFASPIFASGSEDDLDGLVAPIAQRILQVRDQTTSIPELRRESPSLAAHQDFEAGLGALNDWRLSEAESDFRSAIAQDSMFANALHYLALTLYWQTARESRLVLENGPEIARRSQAAERAAETRDVRPGFRAQIDAFGAFWRGDYDAARELYGEILAADSSDVEAWLLLGSVEFSDPTLVATAAGPVPRQNLNLARRAFETAADLAPDWQLAYGQLFDIDRSLVDAARHRRCPGFDPPDSEPRPPFVPTEASDQVGFCPVVEDSIEWVRPDDLTGPLQAAAIANADSVADGSRRLLETWAQIHPNQVRPHEELANWLTWRRSNLGCQVDVGDLRQITADILHQRDRSLELRGDTTAADLLRLAVLHLATDDVETARILLDEGLSRVTDRTVPEEAASVLVALGRADTAVALMRPVWSTWTWGIRDPDGGSPILAGDVAEPIVELRLRAAAGVTGAALRQPFQRLLATWSSPAYTPAQAAHLRSLALRLDVGPALAMTPDVRDRWFEGWEDAGLQVPVLWRGFLAADSAAGSEGDLRNVDRALEAEVARLDSLDMSGPRDHFLAGMLAEVAGRHDVAVRQFQKLESCPLNLNVLTEGWGLRTMARWYRARSESALGHQAAARKAMAAYSAYRQGESTEAFPSTGGNR
jgi:tetratricopeptide (TPR) repeat protein